MLETYRYHAGKFPVTFFTLQLTGEDVTSFLQNQSTHDMSKMNEQSFHLASFLDPQGRIEFYCWILKGKETHHLLVPCALKEKAIARLERFLISEDVTIEDQGLQEWWFVVGPKSHEFSQPDSYIGIMLEEEASLGKHYDIQAETVAPEDLQLWRELNGWPSFDGEDLKAELINNLRLFDLSVSQNKGCYPGQETVSKIATRRGAAYSPVLLEVNTAHAPGNIEYLGKKIGTIFGSYEWQGKWYLTASLLRDFRVEKMKLHHLKIADSSFDGIVHYFPLLPGSKLEKAEELFYKAMDLFKKDNFESAEECLRLAIELNPHYSDAYESLGVMLGRLERCPEAIALMDNLTEVDPSSVLAHTNKSLYLMRLGKIEEAEEQKSMATVKSFQKFGAEAKEKELQASQKKAQESEWAKRESMFQQVLEIDEEDALANYGLGSIAVERAEWLKAIPYLEKVLKTDPQYSVAYLALGKAYKGSGKLDEAKKTWTEGIAVAAKKGDLMPANQMQSELQNL